MWDLAILTVVMLCIICSITSTCLWSVHIPNEWELPRCSIRVSNFHQFAACPCWESHIYSVGWNIFPPLKSGLSAFVTNRNVHMQPAGISKYEGLFPFYSGLSKSHIIHGDFSHSASIPLILSGHEVMCDCAAIIKED